MYLEVFYSNLNFQTFQLKGKMMLLKSQGVKEIEDN